MRLAAELSAKYIHDRHLPDKAIDVLDEAGAKARIGRGAAGFSPPDGGLKAAAPHTQYGLHALRERLDAVYGAEAKLDIARDDAGFEVSFTIPCVQPEGDDDE